MVALIVISVFLIGALFLLYLYRSLQRESTLLRQLEHSQQEREKAMYESIEVGLQEWLKMLELPQLAEETKRQVVAHQLRIALVGPLMRGLDVH